MVQATHHRRERLSSVPPSSCISGYTVDTASQDIIPNQVRYHPNIIPRYTMITPRYHPIIPNRQEGVSKNKGTPLMDGENNGNPYFLMDDLGWFSPLFLGNTQELPAPQPSNTHAGTSNGFTFAAAPLEMISTPVMPTLTARNKKGGLPAIFLHKIWSHRSIW